MKKIGKPIKKNTNKLIIQIRGNIKIEDDKINIISNIYFDFSILHKFNYLEIFLNYLSTISYIKIFTYSIIVLNHINEFNGCK